jgi:soluble lytic murein transglycosylase-like protein
MQLLPSTARRYGTVNLLDPSENIRAGARYLRDLLGMFDNNMELALAAYNAGENAVIRHGRRLPPYAETRRYVPLVVAHYQRLGGH